LLDIFVDADLFSCPKKDEIADLQGRNEKKVGSGMGVGVTLPRPQLGIGAAAESVSEGNRAEEEIAQLSVHVDKMLHLIHLSQMRSSQAPGDLLWRRDRLGISCGGEIA
jgi:hypothetical protein